MYINPDRDKSAGTDCSKLTENVALQDESEMTIFVRGDEIKNVLSRGGTQSYKQ